MKHLYIEYLKKNIRDELELDAYLILNQIVTDGKIKELQSVLSNILNKKIAIDGILGLETLLAFSKVVNKGMLNKIVAILNNPKSESNTNTSTEYVKNFLFTWEGKVIHWLRGEKGPTTPMGVYCPYHPNTEVCKYLKQLYRKYKLKYNVRSNASRLNKLITRTERQRLFNLAMKFYINKYLNDFISLKIKHLPKSYLTYFSNSMNANRGKHGIQYAINTKVDGKVGPKTKRKLLEYINTHSDNDLNNGQLKYIVEKWYCYLAYRSKRKRHFRQFINGWLNRAKSLGYNGKGC